MRRFLMVATALFVWSAAPAFAQAPAASAATDTVPPLTASGAAQIALVHSTQIIQANASVKDAKAGLWSAYSGILPQVAANASRSGSFTETQAGSQAFGGQVFLPTKTTDFESYSGSYGLSGSWSILDLSHWASWSSARADTRSAEHFLVSAKADVVLSTKRQFYEVVKAMHLARVSAQAAQLARDDERRVQALYEVGSVSKSEVLRARVRGSQAQLDSLLASHAVTVQRINLANLLGLPEAQMAQADSTLGSEAATYDAAQVLAEARESRPDILSAEASLKAAELSLRAARFTRLPYVTMGGSWTPHAVSSSTFVRDSTGTPLSTSSTSDGNVRGEIAVNMNIFDGFLTKGRVTSASARVMRAREDRDALVRNLESEVREAMLTHQNVLVAEAVARRSVESAGENLNLVQQKYNVGSATILDLVDAQVQYQRTQSDLVSALSAIRVSEATLDRVRGRFE
jgi:outer membrane protein TolC